MKKFQRRYLLAVTALFSLTSLPVLGFVAVQPPKPFTTGRSIDKKGIEASARPNTLTLQAFNGNNNNDNLGDDWNDLKRAAGNIARKVGSKALDLVEQGGSMLLSAVSQGAEKFMSAFSNTHAEESSPAARPTTTNAESSLVPPMFFDTEDEALFRTVFGEGLFPSTGVLGSVDRVVEQAASILNQDNTVASLLGPSLRYSRPFSQSSRTTTINGRTSSTVQASFQVFGSQGEGIATAVSSQSELLSLDLDVNGRRYRFNTSGSNPSQRRRQQQGFSKKNTSDQDVEILDGFRKPLRGGIVDAEIEGKTFLDSDDNIFI